MRTESKIGQTALRSHDLSLKNISRTLVLDCVIAASDARKVPGGSREEESPSARRALAIIAEAGLSRATPPYEPVGMEFFGGDAINRPAGCLECRETGYLGRAGIYGMLALSPALRRLIRFDCELSKVREQAVKEGMTPLNIAGALKVCFGATSIEEVSRVVGLVDVA